MTEILLATALLTTLILMLSLGVIGARRILAPSHPVQVTVNDTTALQGATGQKLLGILKESDILIPSACAGVGTCGLCRVRISTGSTGEPLPTELARLNRAEIRDGMRLACQVVVRGALSVQVPDAFLSAETLSCKVTSTKMLAPLINEIILKLPEDAAFTPRPGAFAQVTAPAFILDFSEVIVDPAYEPIWQRLGWRGLWINSDAPVTRAYSLANTPADAGNVVLTIRLAVPPPGG